jgi:hypothetical protein
MRFVWLLAVALIFFLPNSSGHGTPPPDVQCPASVVLVLDVSGSMAGHRLEQLKQGAYALLDALSPDARSGLVTFNHQSQHVKHLDHDHQATAVAVSQMVAGGGTDLAAALREGHEELAAHRTLSREVVLFVTDGAGNDPVPEADALKAEGVEIFIIDFANYMDGAYLKPAASTPTAKYYQSASFLDDMGLVFGRVADALDCRFEYQDSPCRTLHAVPGRDITARYTLHSGAVHGNATLTAYLPATKEPISFSAAPGRPAIATLTWSPHARDVGTHLVVVNGTAGGIAADCETTIQVHRLHGDLCRSRADACADEDGDGTFDADDNCLGLINGQADTDGDGIGDACEADSDGDGLLDDHDNCPSVFNAKQDDWDRNGVGDACDDADGDGVVDAHDNCRTAYNPSQANRDSDPFGDACDDSDFDGVMDDVDNCPVQYNPNQADRDGDGIGDACDLDIEGDGHNNTADNCPVHYNPGQEDMDGDGIGDACDDSDRDGHYDAVDNCPQQSNPDQQDRDGNGAGDACDPYTTIGECQVYVYNDYVEFTRILSPTTRTECP